MLPQQCVGPAAQLPCAHLAVRLVLLLQRGLREGWQACGSTGGCRSPAIAARAVAVDARPDTAGAHGAQSGAAAEGEQLSFFDGPPELQQPDTHDARQALATSRAAAAAARASAGSAGSAASMQADDRQLEASFAEAADTRDLMDPWCAPHPPRGARRQARLHEQRIHERCCGRPGAAERRPWAPPGAHVVTPPHLLP